MVLNNVSDARVYLSLLPVMDCSNPRLVRKVGDSKRWNFLELRKQPPEKIKELLQSNAKVKIGFTF